MDALHRLIEAFVPLLVAVDPLGLLPIFLTITHGMTTQKRRRTTIQGVLVALAITLIFMLIGNGLFKLIGIQMADFQIAGGLLLLLLAIVDLLFPGKPAVDDHEIVGLVPLAMPLIAGPASLTTTLVLATRPDLGYVYTTPALLLVYIGLLAVLVSAEKICRVVGMPALKAMSKLVMVLLAAIGVSYLRSGIMAVLAAR